MCFSQAQDSPNHYGISGLAEPEVMVSSFTEVIRFTLNCCRHYLLTGRIR